MTTPKAPSHLGKHGRAFWLRIMGEYELLPQDTDRLLGAAIALDRAHSAREILDKDGVTVTDRFGQQREHPAVRIETASWNSFRLLVRELGLDAEPPKDNRPQNPPRGYK